MTKDMEKQKQIICDALKVDAGMITGGTYTISQERVKDFMDNLRIKRGRGNE